MMHTIGMADDIVSAIDAPDNGKPRLRPGVTSHLYATKRGGGSTYVVRGEDRGNYILTSLMGIRIIECLDGLRDLDEIGQHINSRWRIDVPQSKIRSFLDICAANDLLESDSWAYDREPAVPAEARRERLGIYTKVYNADEYLDFILEYRKWWLNPITKIIAAILLAIGVYNLFIIPDGGGLIAPLKQMDMSYTDIFLLALPFLFLVEMALHELGHALSCRLMGARPKGFGLGLIWGIIPIVFTDTTDAYTIPSKAKRIFVSFAGPMVDIMFFGLVMSLYWVSDPQSLYAKMLIAYSAFPLTSMIVSLNPFYLRMDGYWMLADWLEKPNLRRSSMRYLKSFFRRPGDRASSAKSATLVADGRERAVYATYIIVAISWTAGYVGYVAIESIMTIIGLIDSFFKNSVYM